MSVGKGALLVGAQHQGAADVLETALFTPAAGDYLPGWGYRTVKTSANATQDDGLFDCTGKVLFTLWTGEIITVIGALTSLSINGATDSIVIAASLDIAADSTNTCYLAEMDGTTLLTASTGAQLGQCGGVIGVMMLNSIDTDQRSDSGSGTGAILWEVFYVPLEPAGSVAAN